MTQETETRVAHTPTPWRLHPRSPIDQGHCEGQKPFDYYTLMFSSARPDGADDVCVGTFFSWTAGKDGGWPRVADSAECMANAEFALRAVNSHAALVEACQALVTVIDDSEFLQDTIRGTAIAEATRLLRAALEAAGVTP